MDGANAARLGGAADVESAAENPVPMEELVAQITELAGQLNAATHRWLLLIAEFDRRKGWNDGALKSCAHWLNFKVGLDLGAAREKVRVAHALAGLPVISAAMACGQLSYSKARALTRVATPATEDYFLDIALHGTAQHVERLVRYYRQVEQREALSREEHQQETRELFYWFDTDGSIVLKARLPAVPGAALLKALEAGGDQLYKGRVAAETSDDSTYAMRRADALARVAEVFLAGGGTDAKGSDRYQVIVHADAQTLDTDADGRCEIEGGTPIAAETARRMACDASRIVIKENEKGEPLEIGRKTRTVPPAIRRALASRDRGCQFPGCTHQRFLDAHHVKHWAQGGETALSNLVLLCRFHHRAVHEGGIRIKVLESGAFQFIRQDGRVFDGVLPAMRRWEWRELLQSNLDRGVKIDAHTASTLRRGERMDYGLVIESLLCKSAYERSVSAATRGI